MIFRKAELFYEGHQKASRMVRDDDLKAAVRDLALGQLQDRMSPSPARDFVKGDDVTFQVSIDGEEAGSITISSRVDIAFKDAP
jgi:hypothetical protein